MRSSSFASPSVVARAALLLGLPLISHCTCGGEVKPPPPPIGEGKPVDFVDAGDVYANDAGPVVCEEDGQEDNDVREDAVEVDAAGVVTGTVCGDDDDWFAVASAPGCTVLAELEQTPAEGTVGDIDLLLFDPDGQLVGTSNSPGGPEALNVPAGKTGLYAARLRAGSRDDVAYTLTLSSTCAADLVCPADDRLEDNDDATVPAALSEGVAHDGILCGADQDWFLVPVTVGCVADASVEFTHAQGDIDLELYRPDGTTLVARSAGTDDGERVVRVATEAGMRLKVFFFSAEEANPYRLVVTETCAGQIACPADDPFEPNDEVARARELFAVVDEAVGVICGNDDFYELAPEQGCTLHATLDFVHAEGDLDLELVNASDGAPIAVSNGTTDREQIDHVAPSASPVALHVSGFSGATNVYRLRVETACP